MTKTTLFVSVASVATEDATFSNFGKMIGYVLPGFVALRGLPFLPIAAFAQQTNACVAEFTLAGFLYGTIEAITAGLTVSAVRWLVIDNFHHRLSLRPGTSGYLKRM